MKLSPVLLKLLTLAAGLLGLLLHMILRDYGLDGKGLLIPGFWAGRFLLVLALILLPVLFVLCRAMRGPVRPRTARPGVWGAAGAILGSIAMGGTAISELNFFAPVPSVLALAATVSLLAVGVSHLLGRKPYFLLYLLLCAYFAFRMVNQYRTWNSMPQILEYVFYLGAYIMLMLHAYQNAAVDVVLGSHTALWWTGLSAAFLCFVSAFGTSDGWLLLGCGIWVLTALPRLLPPKRVRAAAPREEV